jgi:hypothetical protein
MRLPSVPHSLDFDRIAALPRRVVDKRDAEEWSRILTPLLAVPGSGVSLLPWQAFALAEVFERRGAFLGYPVGTGKTLILWMLPTVLGAKCPVAIMPASLITSGKTWHDFASYRTAWRSPVTPPKLISFEELALEKNRDMLLKMQPDLVMLDEGDTVSNSRGAAASRLDRYRLANLDAVYVYMTGTPGRMSIMNYWHCMCWCLLDGAPVPMSESEARLWAASLDESNRRGVTRPKPGPLGATLKSAREWYRRRLAETPGVVLVDEDSCNAPIAIRTRLAREDSILDEIYARFLLDFENPGGLPVSDPLSRWILDGQLGCGLFSYYDPQPAEEWRLARRTFAKFVRDTIARTARTRNPLDTELQVARRYADHAIVQEWKRVRGTFDPRKSTRFRWISKSTIASCVDWLAETHAAGEVGVVWCGSVPFGKELARAAGLAYYGTEGKTAGGGGLHLADPRRSLVASWNANKKGFNLQTWGRMLIVLPPQSAKWLEQIVGRAHRRGRDAEVIVDILATSGGTIDAFEAALREAKFAKGTLSLTQKILRARIERARPRITKANHYRWASRTAAGG